MGFEKYCLKIAVKKFVKLWRSSLTAYTTVVFFTNYFQLIFIVVKLDFNTCTMKIWSISYPVKFPQVFLLLLMDHNVDTGDGFGDNTDFAQLRCCAAGHFSHTKAAQFGLKVIELFDQLFLLLGTQLGALDTRL